MFVFIFKYISLYLTQCLFKTRQLVVSVLVHDKSRHWSMVNIGGLNYTPDSFRLTKMDPNRLWYGSKLNLLS